MKDTLTIELKDGQQYIITNGLEHNKEKYILLKSTLNKKEEQIYKYDELNNTIIEIEYEDEYEFIKNKFNELIKQQMNESNILEQIEYNQLIKLKVLNVEENIYILRNKEQLYEKDIIFLTKTKPQKGDNIYMSFKSLNEQTNTYIHIKNINRLNHNNVLIIEHDDTRAYLLKKENK